MDTYSHILHEFQVYHAKYTKSHLRYDFIYITFEKKMQDLNKDHWGTENGS